MADDSALAIDAVPSGDNAIALVLVQTGWPVTVNTKVDFDGMTGPAPAAP